MTYINNNNNNYTQPDVKQYTFAVSDYFTRDRHEKNAAAIAMAMSSLDQDDIFQFTQRLIIECSKYKGEQTQAILVQLKELFYGNSTGLPGIDDEIVPLYFLRSDALTPSGNVRIKGIIDHNQVLEIIPWSVWQSLKKNVSVKILELAAELINLIDTQNNFTKELRIRLDDIRQQAEELQDLFDCEVSELIKYEYFESLDHRNFVRMKKDFITFKRDSPDPDNSKFKIYSRDYFYNLQILISQVFNSTQFSESMYHLCRVATFIEAKMFTKSKEKLFVVGPTNTDIYRRFVSLVHHSYYLTSLSNNHQYFTQDERLYLSYVENLVKSSLMYCGTKIMSLVNFILTIIPYEKRTSGWVEGDMS